MCSRFLGSLRHRGQLPAICHGIGHLMRDDQVVLRVDCGLHVVPDDR
jgi:hypothetical protein